MSHPELQVTTHYSFLRGASSPEELFAAASLLGIPALGVTDRNSLAGMVRAHEAAKVTGVRLVVGCRLDLTDFPSLLVYPTNRPAYARLCRLLTLGKSRAGKGGCQLGWADLEEWQEGLFATLLTKDPAPTLAGHLARLRGLFGPRASCALARRFRPDDAEKLRDIAALAKAARVPTVAIGDILYHVHDRHILQDVVTCIRLGTTIDRAGFRRERHADRFLKAPAETARLFARHRDALARAGEIAAACTFSLDDLTYSYPAETGAEGVHAHERLTRRKADGRLDIDGHGGNLFGLFNPMRGTQHELPTAEELEMPALQALFKQLELPAQCWVGPDATVKRMLDATGAAGAAGYVHLACHGGFDQSDPQASGLQLAGGERLSVARIVRDLRLGAC